MAGPSWSAERAVQSRQARPEEVQQPSWGTAMGTLRPCCPAVGQAVHHHAQAVLAVHNAVARMVALHRDYNVRWLGLMVVKCTMGCGL